MGEKSWLMTPEGRLVLGPMICGLTPSIALVWDCWRFEPSLAPSTKTRLVLKLSFETSKKSKKMMFQFVQKN